ncbi:MAG: TrmH family RNA methyltransferase [Acidobacteriota bacterium]
MPVRIVQSKHNARVKELRQILARPLTGGRVGMEGPNLLAEAIRAGLRMECVFVAQGAEKLLESLDLPEETEILLTPKALLDSALTTETPQPIAALLEPPKWTWADLLRKQAGPGLVVVLAGLQDPGNLGTILRSAEAFGATGVVSLPGTVSPWNPKAIRASAGSVLRVPLIAAGEQDCLARLRAAGFGVFATAVRDARPVGELNLREPVALIIGNEGNGVPGALAAQSDGAVTIPHVGPAESLNAAVAASVLLYEAARQRGANSVSKPAKRRLH